MKPTILQTPWPEIPHNIRRYMAHGITDALRTPLATLLALIAALGAQLPHAADVFRLIVHAQGDWAVQHSYLYALALETAILLFVVNDRRTESYVFAVVSVLTNLAYYHIHGIALFPPALELGAWLDVLPPWLVSVALPIAIALYSHQLAGPHSQKTPQNGQNDAETPKAVYSHPQPAPAQKTPGSDAVAPGENGEGEPGIDKAERARQLLGEGLTKAQIARELGVHRNTVHSWLK